ncbi:hypothetical protein L1286_13285 [Pseudoalteromonas sp. SMS1]|uniref:hypothetical protein n=1 Tax=Pseudoalteromonas sp. SMS1 TaxID=2908894 RepID=UPI001F1B6127|nr:hypothetical protein [Pseudoalteromonas sp. SMS1]MCF2858454.1 hypothetical protein [Pseudoalteromonas sp. SMS1]
MKLAITKKKIKNLSQDSNRLPVNMTQMINGGATSFHLLKTTPPKGDSSDTSVTSPSEI